MIRMRTATLFNRSLSACSALLLAAALVFSGPLSGGAEASGYGKSGSKRTMSVKRSGGKSMKMGNSRRTMGETSGVGKAGARTYKVSRSVLDGNHRSMKGGSLKGGGEHAGIKRYGTGGNKGARKGDSFKGGNQLVRNSNRNTNNNFNSNYNSNSNTNINTVSNSNSINIENNINLSNRSGLRQIAGGRVEKRRLQGSSQGYKATGFSNSGMIIVGVTSGYQEIAGSGQVQAGSRGDDCAYGTYCTIDLGGPKIITLNDVADIEDGEIYEDMSEEEYLRKYGDK